MSCAQKFSFVIILLPLFLILGLFLSGCVTIDKNEQTNKTEIKQESQISNNTPDKNISNKNTTTTPVKTTKLDKTNTESEITVKNETKTADTEPKIQEKSSGSSGTKKVSDKDNKATDETVQPIETKKKQITSFIYQLQQTDFNQLQDKNVSLLVIDPDDSEFDKNQIKQLKESGKIVISYLSIGEAETYRKYWKPEWYKNPPSWIGSENPEWKNNFKVQYWNNEWKDIVFTRIDEILQLGYNGFSLDVIGSAYKYWEQKGDPDAKIEMAKFIQEIREKANESAPNILLFGVGASALIDDANYLKNIDGVVAEETFYFDDNPAQWEKWDVAYLDKALSADKVILTIDYSSTTELQCDFIKKSKEHGFIPFVSVKELDQILKIDCNK